LKKNNGTWVGVESMNTLEKLSETYEIIGKIGSGGGGTIYKAIHKRLNKEVVIKKIHEEIMGVIDSSAEANILKNLRHSYLPQVLDLLILDGKVYTVMDFIPGKSFQQLLDEKKRFSQKQIVKWSKQLCEALEYLHKQDPAIIHSDIKPANIMLTPCDDICLIDFNISSIFREKGARTVGFSDGYSPPEQYKFYKEESSGTDSVNISSERLAEVINKNISKDGYLFDKTELLPNVSEHGKPELFKNCSELEKTDLLIKGLGKDATEILHNESDEDTELLIKEAGQQVAFASEKGSIQSATTSTQYALVDEQSDIYSLGATLYHLLTGIRPEKATGAVTSVASYGVKLSDGLAHIITKAMQRNPSKRFLSATLMLKSLSSINKLDRRYKRFMRQQELTFIIVLFLFASATISIHFGKKRMVEEKLELYNSYIMQLTEERIDENYENMDAIYKDAVKLFPSRIEAFYQRALSLYEQQDYENAINYIENTIVTNSILERSKTMEDIYFILANCYFEKKDYYNAIHNFKSAITLNNENSEYYRDYSISLARTGDTTRASVILKEAIELGIASDSVYLINGEIDFSDGEYPSGEENFLKCIQITTNDYTKMRAYIMCGKLYDKTVAVSQNISENGDILIKKSNLLLEAKNNLPIELTLGIQESLIQSYIDCGTYFNDNNYYDKAIIVSENMVTMNWDTYDTHNNMVILKQKRGDLQNAYEELDKMLVKYGEDYNIYKRFSFLELDLQSEKENEDRDYYTFLGYYEKALELYKSQLKNNMTDIEMVRLDEMYATLVEGSWFK